MAEPQRNQCPTISFVDNLTSGSYDRARRMTDRLEPRKLSPLSVTGMGPDDGRRFAPLSSGTRFRLLVLLTIILALIAGACTTDREPRSVRPRQLRDVP